MYRYTCRQKKNGKIYKIHSEQKLKLHELIFAYAPCCSAVLQVYDIEELTYDRDVHADQIIRINVPRRIRSRFNENTFQLCKIYLTKDEPLVRLKGKQYRSLCEILTSVIGKGCKNTYVVDNLGESIWTLFEFNQEFSSLCDDTKDAITYKSFEEEICIKVEEVHFPIFEDEYYPYDYYKSHEHDNISVNELIKHTTGFTMKERIEKAFSEYDVIYLDRDELTRDEVLSMFYEDSDKIVRNFAKRYKNAERFDYYWITVIDYTKEGAKDINTVSKLDHFKDKAEGLAIEVKQFYLIEAFYGTDSKYCIQEIGSERTYID